MRKMKMSGEIKQSPDGAFAVEVEVGGIPTMAEAQEIGKAVNDVLRELFAAKGASLTRDSSGDAIRRPSSILLPN